VGESANLGMEKSTSTAFMRASITLVDTLRPFRPVLRLGPVLSGLTASIEECIWPFEWFIR